MGAQGVWAGSLWLTVRSDDQPAQKDSYLNASSEDTIRSRAGLENQQECLKINGLRLGKVMTP